jgi:hypothetical protein
MNDQPNLMPIARMHLHQDIVLAKVAEKRSAQDMRWIPQCGLPKIK